MLCPHVVAWLVATFSCLQVYYTVLFWIYDPGDRIYISRDIGTYIRCRTTVLTDYVVHETVDPARYPKLTKMNSPHYAGPMLAVGIPSSVVRLVCCGIPNQERVKSSQVK